MTDELPKIKKGRRFGSTKGDDLVLKPRIQKYMDAMELRSEEAVAVLKQRLDFQTERIDSLNERLDIANERIDEINRRE